MSLKTIEIVEQLKSLTLTEAAELVKQVEDTFRVDASPRQRTSIIEIIEEKSEELSVQTEFDVVLEEVPADKKIAILKVVRTLTNLDLKSAKDFVESAPKVVKEAIALSDAEEIKQQLEAAGAKVSLK
ncbi:50S ribosomal protein L7/L12 [Coleofasciculus sp. FACHB-64]|uniref:50S ribosomal protein L7/L12 n=1 Tax=Cyanophyceae TaxID=3028117 RepID=UPI001684408B|nr:MULTISPECIES: 50S ribosomal protein L7/L12 [unclassified Coleofasciculus]MBD1838346.1 50S ribosomal protein L7/L12 [Coleofasciculus sp. FACHB-501]MBD2045043.1 50S ribosomal protein L7/L12 [Coleofasciculus sp. FACHB-64]